MHIAHAHAQCYMFLACEYLVSFTHNQIFETRWTPNNEQLPDSEMEGDVRACNLAIV